MRSINKAKSWIREAEKSFQGEAYDSSVLSSYLAMFHSARAILFSDGYREKRHACVARYLEEKYVSKKNLGKKWVELLDHHREIRHDDKYEWNELRGFRGRVNSPHPTWVRELKRFDFL